MSDPTSSPEADATKIASTLDDLVQQLRGNPETQSAWNSIEAQCRQLADALRTKDGPVDTHTIAGETSIPANLVQLLKLIGQRPVSATISTSLYEQLRVGANLCMDHDANRQILLTNEYPQSVLAILENYATIDAAHISLSDVKIIKTAIGVLLNTSLGYDPVRSLLTAKGAPKTMLKLSTILYATGAWATRPNAEVDDWQWLRGLSAWSWRAIHEFSENVKEPVFDASCLPYLLRPFDVFSRSVPNISNTLSSDAQSRKALVETDIDVLEEVSSQLETLSLDHEHIRMALAASLSEPGEGSLKSLLRFIEEGTYPPYWADDGPEEEKKREKAFDVVKSAAIKVLTVVAGEEKALSLLWSDTPSTDGTLPGGWFVTRMVTWIRDHAGDEPGKGREDLIIGATLTLGNLARQEAKCIAIVQPPIELVPHLCKLLEPAVDIKVKHGTIGLLKHLAQSPANRAILGEAGILEKLSASNVWTSSNDMAEIVQVSAIGVSKHLCNSSLTNTLRLMEAKGIDQILDLVRRSDSVVLKSEGTRVIVNAVKSLWGTVPPDASPELQQRRKSAVEKLAVQEPTTALARLVGRSKKHPILLNEGSVALTLIAAQTIGAPVVFRAITEPLPAEVGSGPSETIPGSDLTPEPAPAAPAAPRTALNMIEAILLNEEGQFPPELRSNACALLVTLSKKIDNLPAGSVEGFSAFRESTVTTLKSITDLKDDVVKTAVDKALQALSS